MSDAWRVKWPQHCARCRLRWSAVHRVRTAWGMEWVCSACKGLIERRGTLK